MSLYDCLKDVKDKIVFDDSIRIDNFVFKLHYVGTVTLLLTFSVLLSLSQYAGDPIDCRADHGFADSNTFDQYCWVEGTYTKRLNNDYYDKQDYMNDDLSNVRCFDKYDNPKKECWHHQYYQWVALVLVVQAGCFYFPRYLWQIFEDGRISSLVTGLDRRTLIRGLQSKNALRQGELNKKINLLIWHWRQVKGTNNGWSFKFYFCELLNLINVIFQFYFTNYFLGGQFHKIALDGWNLDEHHSILPLIAECQMKIFGTGGHEEKFFGLCVLPLNLVNQKFYTIFWFWLSFLLFISSASFVIRLFLITSTNARDFVLRYYYGLKEFNRCLVLKSSHGDWFLLTSLLKNMNGIVNSYFIVELGKIKDYSIYDSFEN